MEIDHVNKILSVGLNTIRESDKYFLGRDGQIIVLPNHVDHEQRVLLLAGITLKRYLSIGGCRVNLQHESLAIETAKPLTDKQIMAVVKLLKQPCDSLYYYCHENNKSVEITAWDRVKPYQWLNSMKSKK